MKEMLSLLLPVESVQNIANLIFTTFDKDNSGSLNFVEFVTSIHCMSTSSPEVCKSTPTQNPSDVVNQTPTLKLLYLILSNFQSSKKKASGKTLY